MRATLCVLTLAGALLTAPAVASTKIVVLPPDASRYGPQLLKHLADAAVTLPPGDEIHVYTARPVSPIAQLFRPRDPSLNAARIKVAMTAQFKPVKEFLSRLPSGAAGDTPAALQIPLLMDELSANVISSLPEKRAHILLVGSLLFHDRRTARTSMLDRYVPSDGVLSAKHDEWVFSTAEAHGRLAGSVIHFCSPEGEAEHESSQHALRLQRFWSLYVSTQSGAVGTFSNDLATCFRRWATGDSSGQPTYQLMRDAKPEMIRVPANMPATAPTSYDTPGQWFLRDDVVISKNPATATKGILWAGIKWKTSCDFDIYSRPDPASPWLFFASGKTADGHFNRDFTSGTGEGQGQYEYVEYTREVDLSRVELAVNLYSCDGTAVQEGIVRIWFSGKVFQSPFKLGARTGNRGGQPIAPPYWVRIDLQKLVGLTRSDGDAASTRTK